MHKKLVKDLMISLKDYPSIEDTATVYEALMELEKSIKSHADCQESFRAILIKNREGKIIGKAGQLSFLKALIPTFEENFPVDKKVNLRSDDMQEVKNQFDFWRDSLEEFSRDASSMSISEFMQPVNHCVDVNASVSEAVAKLVRFNTISLLACEGKEIKGIIRLTDIFNEMKSIILKA